MCVCAFARQVSRLEVLVHALMCHEDWLAAQLTEAFREYKRRERANLAAFYAERLRGAPPLPHTHTRTHAPSLRALPRSSTDETARGAARLISPRCVSPRASGSEE